MCNNSTVLYVFFVLKIIIYFIMPITLIFIRKKKFFKIILYINILLLLFFAINNFVGKNSCINNSSIKMINFIKRSEEKDLDRKIYDLNTGSNSSININPEKISRTYSGKELYYYNQNRDYMKNAYYECDGKKVYMNSFGSIITSYSIAISTLFQRNINPVDIFNNYKENYDLCNSKITLENINSATMKKYGGIYISEIDSSQIESSLKNGDIVIAELLANEDSKLTCDFGYIVIYNTSDNKYMIADPALPNSSYICPFTSNAYGNTIDSNNMEKNWSLDEIDNDAIRYYLVKRGV